MWNKFLNMFDRRKRICMYMVFAGLIIVLAGVLGLLLSNKKTADADASAVSISEDSNMSDSGASISDTSTVSSEENSSTSATKSNSSTGSTTTSFDKVNDITVTVPKPTSAKAAAKVKMVNGVPKLYINGIDTPPLLTFVNAGYASYAGTEERLDSELQLAADASINIVSVPVDIGWMIATDSTNYASVESALNTAIANNPDCFILLRVNVCLSGSSNTTYLTKWFNEHPGDQVTFAEGTHTFDGSSVGVSLASEDWIKGANKVLSKLIAYLQNKEEYSSRIIGYHPTGASTGEWFQWGCREKGVDVSESNNKAFRKWLTEKYGSNTKLQTAWNDGSVTLSSAQVPVVPGNANTTNSTSVLLSAGDTRYMDYYEYNSNLVTDSILQLAKTVKTASNNNALCVVFYGYDMEVNTPISGHNHLTPLLESSYIDGISSPVSYYDRNEGGLGSFMAPVDSVQSAGKLWFIESDIRTRSNSSEPDASYNPSCKSIQGAIEVQKRDFGAMLTRGMGTWWMDLWGSGWLDDASIWNNIEGMQKLYKTYVDTLKPASGETVAFQPEVAVILDEDGTYRFGSPMRDTGELLFYGVRESIYRAGVTVGYYTTYDLMHGNIPSSVKLFILPEAWHIDNEEMAGIKKYQVNGNTFLYLSGFGDNSAARVNELTGMNMSIIQSAGTQINLTNTTNILVNSLNSICKSFTLNPLYSLTGGTVLGQTGGANSLTYKDNGSYKAVYAGCLRPTAEFYRNVAKYAGVNVFITSGDTLTGNHEMITIHTQTNASGTRHITFLKKTDVYDYFNQKWYQDVSSIDLPVKASTTYYLFYGNKEDFLARNIYGFVS